MQINISEIISTSHKTEDFSIMPAFEHVTYSKKAYKVIEKEPVTMTVSNKGNSQVSITGRFKVVLDMPCDRCLSSVPVEISSDYDTEIDFKKLQQGDPETLEDTSFIEESLLDIDKFVYGEILVHFPDKILCREDCKGLCLNCGKNLNHGDCGCDHTSPDPRMSAIRDIFNNFKEV